MDTRPGHTETHIQRHTRRDTRTQTRPVYGNGAALYGRGAAIYGGSADIYGAGVLLFTAGVLTFMGLACFCRARQRGVYESGPGAPVCDAEHDAAAAAGVPTRGPQDRAGAVA
eukprot:3106751-Rhodomonas_salina.1